MKSLLQLIKPTALVSSLLIIFLLFQAIIFSAQTTTISLGEANLEQSAIFSGIGTPNADITEANQSAVLLGIGTPLAIITENGKTSFRINWAVAILNLTLTYGLSALLAAAFTKSTRLRRPALTFNLVGSGLVLVTLFVSIVLSKIVWGYYFTRPQILPEVKTLTKVMAVIPFKSLVDSSNKRTLVPDADDYSFSNRIASARQDSYYCLDERILIELDHRGLLPANPTTTLDSLPEFYPLIQNSGALAASDAGYDSAAHLRGIIVDATDNSGNRLVLLGMTGGQLSNDHYPYYEMLFRGKQGAALAFVRSQQFFYDVAGMEGFEWYAMWLILTLPTMIAGLFIFTLGRAFWVWRQKKPSLIQVNGSIKLQDSA